MRLRPIALAAALLMCASAGARADLRLGHQVAPRFESVRLTVDAARTDYSGTAHIDLDVAAATDSFRFHARAMKLNTLKLAGASGPIAVTHSSGDQGLVVVHA